MTSHFDTELNIAMIEEDVLLDHDHITIEVATDDDVVFINELRAAQPPQPETSQLAPILQYPPPDIKETVDEDENDDLVIKEEHFEDETFEEGEDLEKSSGEEDSAEERVTLQKLRRVIEGRVAETRRQCVGQMGMSRKHLRKCHLQRDAAKHRMLMSNARKNMEKHIQQNGHVRRCYNYYRSSVSDYHESNEEPGSSKDEQIINWAGNAGWVEETDKNETEDKDETSSDNDNTSVKMEKPVVESDSSVKKEEPVVESD